MLASLRGAGRGDMPLVQHADLLCRCGLVGLTPLARGAHPGALAFATARRTHPRLRWEHRVSDQRRVGSRDSPPLARGAPERFPFCRRDLGLTLACAGSTAADTSAARHRRHSPPLARGAPHPLPRRRPHQGLTPACAGSTLIAATAASIRRTHPRLRGEHCPSTGSPTPSSDSPPLRGEHVARGSTARRPRDSPPLARGAPRARRLDNLLSGLTPACAGSTDAGDAARKHFRTHPRLRGEHSWAARRPLTTRDSPPLARGAHQEPR